MNYKVICPLDPRHEILRTRLQYHIVKCMRNHRNEDNVVCPYNAAHIVHADDLQDHLNKCLDYRYAHGHTLEADHRELAGIIPVEDVIKRHGKRAGNEENWDGDIKYVPTYDPRKGTEGRLVLRTTISFSKLEKLQFRLQERERMSRLKKEMAAIVPALENKDEQMYKNNWTLPLRLPRSFVL